MIEKQECFAGDLRRRYTSPRDRSLDFVRTNDNHGMGNRLVRDLDVELGNEHSKNGSGFKEGELHSNAVAGSSSERDPGKSVSSSRVLRGVSDRRLSGSNTGEKKKRRRTFQDQKREGWARWSHQCGCFGWKSRVETDSRRDCEDLIKKKKKEKNKRLQE